MSRLAGRRGVLCLVTAGDRLVARAQVGSHGVEDRIVAQVREAAHAGVDLVQVREPGLEARDLLRLVERCLEAAAGCPTRIIVNDRTDVALAAGAHGVHLRGDSYSAGRVRAMVPSDFLVGRSVHDPDEAAAVAGGGAVDYLVFGTVFASRSKAPGHYAAGVEGLASAVRAARLVPVLAIGGISLVSAPLVAAAGAAGIAAIGLFLPGELGSSVALADVVRRLREAFDSPADLG